MKPGMIVCSGRLPGASSFGWPGSSVNSAPRFCRAKPVPGATSPLPKPWKMLWISDTMLPSRSIADRYTVSPPGPVVSPASRSGSTCAAARAACRWTPRGAPRAPSSSSAGTGAAAKRGIAHPAQHVGVGELLGLDHRVQRVHAVEAVARRAAAAPSGPASSAPRCPGCWAAARRPSSRDRSVDTGVTHSGSNDARSAGGHRAAAARDSGTIASAIGPR